MKNNFSYIVLLALLVTGACAPTRFVQPLEKGQHSVGLDFGGPLIEFSGMIIPTPLSNINYGYGFKENLTAFGSIHTTSLAYGNIQTDVGVTYKFWKQEGLIPNLSASSVINFVTNIDLGAPKVWPQLDLNAYWEHGKNNSYFYAGFSNWFELASTRAHEEESLDRWLLNPQFGYVFKTESWAFNLEMKLMGLGHSNEQVFVPYRTITGSNGSTGLFLGVSKRF